MYQADNKNVWEVIIIGLLGCRGSRGAHGPISSNTGHPERGPSPRPGFLSASPNLLPLGPDGLLLLLQPPPHLLLQPEALLLLVRHGRLHPAQLVQQLGDDRARRRMFCSLMLMLFSNVPGSFRTRAEPLCPAAWFPTFCPGKADFAHQNVSVGGSEAASLSVTDLFLHLLLQFLDGLDLQLPVVVHISLCLWLNRTGGFFLLRCLIQICLL